MTWRSPDAEQCRQCRQYRDRIARQRQRGVGREVYVRDKNVATRTLTLSQPLYGGAGTRLYLLSLSLRL